MKVVLLEDLVGRGRLGDVITVKDGFARNYLLPRRKALRATADNLEIFANRRADIEMRAAADRKAAMELAARAETLRLFLTAQAGPGGQLYGSVRPRQIAVALVEQGIAITPAQVVLRSPVRAIGRHAVELHFHADAVVFVDLYVGRSEEEFVEVGVAQLSAYERRDQALAILEALAITAENDVDATGPLVKVAQYAGDDAGERAWRAVRAGSSTEFEDTVKEVLAELDVNCLVGLRGDLDAVDPTLIHMQMDFHGALSTRLGNDRTFRLLSGDVLCQAEVDLSLFATNATPIAPVERKLISAADGEVGHIRLSQTLKRLTDRVGAEPFEVWAMAQVNGACVHRRVWSFA